MKKALTLLMAMAMMLCLLAACSGEKDQSTNSQSSSSAADQSSSAATDQTSSSAAEDSQVNLMDMYTVTDPEGVEYDQRVALYAPVLESDENYAAGQREIFAVLYGKDGKGVFMYDVIVFDTEDSANAYRQDAGAGEVDGTVYVKESGADLFAAMESYVPTFQTWIDNMMASGMVEVE
ncbi:MAG: hypothetical protein ACOYJZ_03775 [Acutalibacter sp.]|jgi:hypothetical protein